MRLAAMSDEALAAHTRGGDQRAFEALVGRYERVIGAALRAGPVFGFGMTGEDAWQEALMGLWRACRAHRPERPCFRIVSEALSLQRPIGDDGPPLSDRLPTGRQSDPAVIVELREEFQRLVAEDRDGVERALRSGRQLDPRARTAVSMIAQGNSQRQTAKAVRASESTVRRWIREAA